MVSRNNSLISLIFSLVKEYLSLNESWNLDLVFWKQKLFQCELKQFAFWNLATPWLYFLEKRWLALVWRYCHWWKYVMRWPFLWVFKVKGSKKSSRFCLRKKARGFVWEKFISFWTLILSAWIIISSLFSMSWLLWKSTLCILRALFTIPSCLLAWLEKTSTGT
jgi:hypothetical protein